MATPIRVSTPKSATFPGSPTTTPPPIATEENSISLKVSKLLTNPVDDAKTKAALEALSEFYTSNTPIERRNLRGQVELKVIETNQRFLGVFDKIVEQLSIIETEIHSMSKFCDEMEIRLESANQQTAFLLEQADSLKSQRETCKTRKILIDAFLQRFTLSEKEIFVLSSGDSVIGSEFFDALKHLQQIHGDCDALLITENQRAGLEIMERMNSYQETAFDKLYRWTLSEIRTLGREALEIPITLKNALRTLKQRPVLFQSCLEELVYIRRNAIIRIFMDALTRGGPGGTPRPIELHARDPLRYVGDMLAWIHQAVAAEREFLEGLFDFNIEENNVSTLSENTVKESDDIIIQDLLDRDLDGTCRPLKTRVEQVLGSQQGTITAYRIVNLIQFYKFTISRILGPNAALSSVLEDITESASRVFFNTLNFRAEQLLRYVQTPGTDLLPPPAVKETILQLNEIMASYETSLVASSERERDFAGILNAILDPLLQMCEMGAKNLSRFNEAIYMINCLHYVQSALVAYKFTHGRVTTLEAQIEEHLEILVDEQYMNLLEQSGLAPLVRALETKDENTPLSLLPNMDTRSLTGLMARLDSFLTLGDADNFRLSGNPKPLVKRVNQRVSRLFVEAYKRLVDAIRDPKNRYEFPATILIRTVDEVETLISDAIEGWNENERYLWTSIFASAFKANSNDTNESKEDDFIGINTIASAGLVSMTKQLVSISHASSEDKIKDRN
ncbi:9616_t:CDS:10 [Ambispora leptoticha]|uniref:Conserved oligomeric Golgi complex subunit 6 n=1 Tax=Ambispora leptoticha TaxID=144679 RepID=A0A9N9CEZ1_9GLOM|nr:9616_t:CDS:10 [Ambispora leptoticha]